MCHLTTEALAEMSSSGASSSRDSAQATAPPPPISFFHRIFSSDLSRARETAELIVQELRTSEGSGSGGGVICFDRDLREILGGASRGVCYVYVW